MHVDQTIVDLLADKSPIRARDLMLAWEERRTASWIDAAREAEIRAASGGHLPQIRGQLRYHYGERALAEAARSAGAGAIPLRTNPPGGVFMVARVGRFALVSLVVRYPGLMPRKSISRKILSQANETLDPQSRLALGDDETPRIVTELAYFGCLAVVPSRADPTSPAILALGVPNRALSEWICWIPSHRLNAELQARVDAVAGKGEAPSSGSVPDEAFPTFRVPKPDETGKEEP